MSNATELITEAASQFLSVFMVPVHAKETAGISVFSIQRLNGRRYKNPLGPVNKM